MKHSETEIRSNRRSFLKKSALAAGAATMGAGLLTHGMSTFAQTTGESSGPLSAGDIAFFDSWPRPSSSKVICGLSMRNWVVSAIILPLR